MLFHFGHLFKTPGAHFESQIRSRGHTILAEIRLQLSPKSPNSIFSNFENQDTRLSWKRNCFRLTSSFIVCFWALEADNFVPLHKTDLQQKSPRRVFMYKINNEAQRKPMPLLQSVEICGLRVNMFLNWKTMSCAAFCRGKRSEWGGISGLGACFFTILIDRAIGNPDQNCDIRWSKDP